jgi:phospholipid/cholesterol/gamma-HCH transport system substrate-binding protein
VKRLLAFVIVATLGLAGCGFGQVGGREFKAQFTRAVQVFPGIDVRVLGVDVGTVTDVRNVADGVEITFRIEDSEVKLPADVNGAVVPSSLLGERYIQLFPAYTGGPQMAEGGLIPISRTAVPSEPDELLTSLQDYLGALDQEAVTAFVENAAEILEGNGENLNRLLEGAAGVVGTLASKRDDLADLIVEFNKVTLALGSRQEALGRLIQTYNDVASTLTNNRTALEGTVTGLNTAAFQLASLLLEHRDALDFDIDVLTKTGRTLGTNVDVLTVTTQWAADLFEGASRAVDFEHDWLRLNNQGEPLEELILERLQERLIELCIDVGAPECTTPKYWSANVPSLFCFSGTCPAASGSASEQLARAIEGVPEMKKATEEQDRESGGSGSTDDLVDDLLHQTLGGSR